MHYRPILPMFCAWATCRSIFFHGKCHPSKPTLPVWKYPYNLRVFPKFLFEWEGKPLGLYSLRVFIPMHRVVVSDRGANVRRMTARDILEVYSSYSLQTALFENFYNPLMPWWSRNEISQHDHQYGPNARRHDCAVKSRITR